MQKTLEMRILKVYHVDKEYAGGCQEGGGERGTDLRGQGEMGTETLDSILRKMEVSSGMDAGGIGADLCFSLGYNGGGEKWLDSGHVRRHR